MGNCFSSRQRHLASENTVRIINSTTIKSTPIREYLHLSEIPMYLKLINLKVERIDNGHECIICLEDITPDIKPEEICCLPCSSNIGHLYHTKCLMQWFSRCSTNVNGITFITTNRFAPTSGQYRILEVDLFRCPYCQQKLLS